MRDVPPANSAPARIAGLAFANAVGFSAAIAVPLWVGPAAQRFDMPLWMTGAIASLQLGCSATTNVLGSVFNRRLAPRTVAIATAIAAATGYLIAALPHLIAFVAGCALAGLALGALLATIIGMVARSPDAQRHYSILTSAHVLFAALLYFVMPSVIVALGFESLFIGLAALCILVVPALRRIPHRPFQPGAAPKLGAVANAALGAIALASVASMLAAHNAVQSYVIVLGNRIGISVPEVSALLAIGMLTSLGGPVAAVALGDRFGLLRPLLIGILGMAAAATSLTMVVPHSVFAAALVVFATLIMFVIPYTLALLSRLDGQGRWAAMAPAALMIGGALGPTLSALVLVNGHLASLGPVAAVVLVVAGVGFLAASHQSAA